MFVGLYMSCIRCVLYYLLLFLAYLVPFFWLFVQLCGSFWVILGSILIFLGSDVFCVFVLLSITLFGDFLVYKYLFLEIFRFINIYFWRFMGLFQIFVGFFWRFVGSDVFCIYMFIYYFFVNIYFCIQQLVRSSVGTQRKFLELS